MVSLSNLQTNYMLEVCCKCMLLMELCLKYYCSSCSVSTMTNFRRKSPLYAFISVCLMLLAFFVKELASMSIHTLGVDMS